MAIYNIPQQKSALSSFTEGFSPYLQMAMQTMLKRKQDEQARQKNLEQAQTMFPEAFTQSLNPQGQAKYNMDMVSPDMRQEALGQVMPSIPEQYKQTAFNPQAAQKYPGLGINFRTGEMDYKVPSSGGNVPIFNINTGGIPEQVGSVPRGAKIVQPNVAQEKFNLEKEEKMQKNKVASDFIIERAQDSLNTIAEIEKGMSNFGIGGIIPAIPGLQPQKMNWEANVNKILSGKVVDLITEMKSTSKTGATGFGQLSDKEGQILREASTALKKGLSPQDAQRYIDIMKEKLQKVISGGGQSQRQEDFSTMSDDELRRIALGG